MLSRASTPGHAAALGLVAAAWIQAHGETSAQTATADRVQGRGWWPTKGDAARSDYVGPGACATCHKAMAATQETTSMARTAMHAGDSGILRTHALLTFQRGAYAYTITRGDRRSIYSVTDGKRSVSAPLAWAFGAGNVGQSYLFEREGKIYEGRVSYYDSVRALGVTPGRGLAAPGDLEEAMARPVGHAEVRRCFGCHTTASTTRARLGLGALIPGVTCEACHGPGKTHVTGMERGRIDETRGAIMNPRPLDPVDSVDFCGACHATFWDVKLAGESGIAALRSQPYRLQSSRCWGKGDARITCVACHDPHKPLVRDPLAYDPRCLSCHAQPGSKATPAHPAPPCKTGTEKCVTCHMPKYEVPDTHHEFTDHQIRIVRRTGPRSERQ